MATFELPDHLIERLSTVLEQLQNVLPEPKQSTDFSSPAFKWQNKQLKAIHQPRPILLEDLKGI